MGVDKATFRAIMGSFAAGVTVITVKDVDGSPKGFTASSLTSLSLNPPLLLVCVDNGADTLPAMQEASVFAVNMLRHGEEEVSARFASKGIDKFAVVDYVDGPLGTPILEGRVIAYCECTVRAKYPGGDHTIFVGEIEHGTALEGSPLTYFRGTYGTHRPNPPAG